MKRIGVVLGLFALIALAAGLTITGGPGSASAVPALLIDATALSSGEGHTCAIIEGTAGGGVQCWGYGEDGQLGDGAVQDSWTPVHVAFLRGDSGQPDVTDVSAGHEFTCVVADGGAKCWGDNDNGQLGDDSTANRTVPTDVDGLSSGIAAVAAGAEHACALTTGGGVKCWGNNTRGQLGDDQTCGTGNCLTPIDVTGLSSGVTAIAAGGGEAGVLGHTCALLTGGGVKCWGSNQRGQLGDTTATDRYTPVDVCAVGETSLPCAALADVRNVTAAGAHTCVAIDNVDKNAQCWGHRYYGRLGNGINGIQSYFLDLTPTDVCATGKWDGDTCFGGAALTDVDTIHATGPHTCAILTTDEVRCWGYNFYGELGNGTFTGQFPGTVSHYNPVDVCAGEQGSPPSPCDNNLDDVAGVAVGDRNSCALVPAALPADDYGVMCWGDNFWGQIGNDDNTDVSSPVNTQATLDNDGDGCTAAQEAAINDAHDLGFSDNDFWDFFDTPDANNVRDRVIDQGDIDRVAARWNKSGDPTIDPLSVPPPTGYHTAFDHRTSAGATGPDGFINLTNDILTVAGQSSLSLSCA